MDDMARFVIADSIRNPCHKQPAVVHDAWIPDQVRDDGQREGK